MYNRLKYNLMGNSELIIARIYRSDLEELHSTSVTRSLMIIRAELCRL